MKGFAMKKRAWILLVAVLLIIPVVFSQSDPATDPDLTVDPTNDSDLDLINVGTDTDPFWAISLFVPLTPTEPGAPSPVSFKIIVKQGSFKAEAKMKETVYLPKKDEFILEFTSLTDDGVMFAWGNDSKGNPWDLYYNLHAPNKSKEYFLSRDSNDVYLVGMFGTDPSNPDDFRCEKTGEKSCQVVIKGTEANNVKALMATFSENQLDFSAFPNLGGAGDKKYLAFTVSFKPAPKGALRFSKIIVSTKSLDIVNKEFKFDGSVPEQNLQPFSLQIDSVDTGKKLYLGVDVSCESWLTVLESGVKQFKKENGTKSDFSTRLQKYKQNVVSAWTDDEYVKAVTKTIGYGVLEVGRQIISGGVDIVASIAEIGEETWNEIKKQGFWNWLKSKNKTDQPTKIEGVQEFDLSTVQEKGELPIKNVKSKKGYIVEPKFLKETTFWKIDSIDGQNPSNLNGREHTFSACQFSEDSTNPEKFKLAGSDKMLIQFGKTECTSLLDCLAKIDQVFINRLFGS